MIIELFGLPGAGKTTVANRLINEGFFVIKKPRLFLRIIYSMLYFFINPKFALSLFYHLILNVYRSKYVSKLKLFNFWFFVIYTTLLAKYFIVTFHRKESMVIFDEGLAQFFLGTSINQSLIPFKKLIEYSEYIIIIKVDERERLSNINRRDGFQTKAKFGTKYKTEFNKRIVDIANFLEKRLNANDEITTFSCDGYESVKQNINFILNNNKK